jgi:hypothetical protein
LRRATAAASIIAGEGYGRAAEPEQQNTREPSVKRAVNPVNPARAGGRTSAARRGAAAGRRRGRGQAGAQALVAEFEVALRLEAAAGDRAEAGGALALERLHSGVDPAPL